jgi:CheY-like chemotaxis protein
MEFHGPNGQPRVLLLDDDELLPSFYKEVMEEEGVFKVECESDVATFLKRIRLDKKWDAIVLDVMMPHPGVDGMSYAESDDGLLTGVLLVRRVREIFPSLPIFILTNRVPPDLKGHLEKVDNVQIMTKFRYPPPEFTDAVRQVLKSEKV